MSEKSSSRVTTDHEEIKKWIDEKGGRPTRVKSTGTLRIDFADGEGPEDAVEEISWSDFFKEFDKGRLAFLYQEEEGDGKFFKLISRDNA